MINRSLETYVYLEPICGQVWYEKHKDDYIIQDIN